MAAKIVTLDQQRKRLNISETQIQNDLVFAYFDKLPEADRDDALFRALYIGVLAMMEDRIAAFFARTQNELGTELEHLKIMFDMQKEIFFSTSVKGLDAETRVLNYLTELFSRRGITDTAVATGATAGNIDKNKSGDVLCHVEGRAEKPIAIEVKFDKGMGLGDIADKDVFTRRYDTAWSQVIEARANRGGPTGIIVFDLALTDASILKLTDSVAFIQGVGFICIVDSQAGDFTHLGIAYMLARDIVLNAKEVQLDDKMLTLIVERILFDLDRIGKIRKAVEKNVSNNLDILRTLEQSTLMMEFNRDYLNRFLRTGTLSAEDLLEFYFADDVKARYKVIEDDIEALAGKTSS